MWKKKVCQEKSPRCLQRIRTDENPQGDGWDAWKLSPGAWLLDGEKESCVLDGENFARVLVDGENESSLLDGENESLATRWWELSLIADGERSQNHPRKQSSADGVDTVGGTSSTLPERIQKQPGDQRNSTGSDHTDRALVAIATRVKGCQVVATSKIWFWVFRTFKLRFLDSWEIFGSTNSCSEEN